MSDQLVYTSAPRGLRPGSSGFCTVAATPTLGPLWVERLEALSAYRPLFPAGDARESSNPIAFSHARLAVGGQTRSLLSRVAASGLDHTGRSNKLAHHLLLSDAERPAAGPAWVLRQPGLMRDRWHGDPIALPAPTLPASSEPTSLIARTWAASAGDAGWAGWLAGRALAHTASTTYIVYPLGCDALALADEALRLLPPERRWDVTFSTYFTDAVPGVSCAWRFVVEGMPIADVSPRSAVLNLAAPDSNLLADAPLVEAARTGTPPPAPAARAPLRGLRPAVLKVAAPTSGTPPLATPAVAAPPAMGEPPSHPLGNTDAHRGVGFWLLVVGLPIALLCIVALVLLILSARPHGAASVPALDRSGVAAVTHGMRGSRETA